jgi:ElaB/YqjD/DUF883 family membrane-anchored ribosome-binding protein
MADYKPGGSSPQQHPRPGMGGTATPERPGQGGVMGSVSETAQQVAEGAQRVVGQARETVGQYASNLADAAQDQFESFNEMVRRNPVPALLIAGGIGLLLGMALAGGAAYSFSGPSYGRRW